ncbi:TPA: hypothetical protein SL688_005742 [Pseudomonas aeruginosa]|nr:hypothetical protein [Pseudomonas aeruginosa]HEJ3905515.1 hypothetical protein [Pseudomonas aeruginosa]HEJ5239788.1 hypothetical protein [Pseudomonas aeruginosa]HEJ5323195.1 hypothetical protein [Pseudomonas aeruginosa]
MTESKICTCPSGDGSLVHPCPAHPAVEQAGGDERAAFEVWASPLGWKLSPDQNNCGIVVAERYGHPGVQRCWEAWQARAALAQPSPAQAEKAEVERTEGSADLLAIVREAVAGAYNEWKMISEAVTEIMEVHERIVGELRADRDSWAEQAEQRLADWDEMRKERDAALARVAELEKKLAMASDAASKGDAARHAAGGMEMEIQELKAKLVELENQEPLLYINPLVVDELLGRAKRSPGGLTWSKGRCGSWTLPLYAAPVAQAQHSVPEEFIGRLSEFLAQRGATGKALLRELRAMLAAAPGNSAQHSVPAYVSYTTQPAESLAGIALRQLKDESRWVEIRDINAHAFPDMRSHSYYPAGTVIKLPAAAPGKEGV